ncbi:hypothetical protein BQ8482_120106 [Mesorhizobium delmotii]|uniref:Uncharacterized protein n=1 Tax=Mesorhizobium delmotii TaxID=1631247 RepID=A0A2P9AFZ2_9HYPH|nr:hypothetical protein BQ8482_120106 [Mesorhizobium delmotii]
MERTSCRCRRWPLICLPASSSREERARPQRWRPPLPVLHGERVGVRGSANAGKSEGKSKPEAIAPIEGLGRLDYFPAAATRHARRHRRRGFLQPRLLGNRLTVDPRTLTPLVLVRIQVPQPSNFKHLATKTAKNHVAKGV